ncbi:MAG: glycosyltransferase family 1 protein [Thermomicrobiales bacterium]|jgi:glycosyltransferase involved in cell wall biosynthesis
MRLSDVALRVAFDMRLAGYRAGGIARYSTDLAAALRRQPDIDLVPLRAVRDPAVDPSSARFRTPPHHRLERYAVPVELMLRRVRPDIYHAVDLIAPILPGVPAVATVYDLAFLRWPEDLAADALAYYRQLGRSARWTREWIVPSAWTAADLVERYAIDPARVTVIPLGVTMGIDDQPALPRSSRGDYVLAVGTVEPRKRYDLLLDALHLVDPTIRLVVAGHPGWRSDDTQTRLQAATASGRVEWLVGPSDADVWRLYREAIAVVLPSRVEGFGLAALEGMAVGTPVISSGGGALPEVTGAVAIEVIDGDPGEWAAAIERVAGDAELWRSLSAGGVTRAKQFDWDDAAARTVAVYQRAVGH